MWVSILFSGFNHAHYWINLKNAYRHTAWMLSGQILIFMYICLVFYFVFYHSHRLKKGLAGQIFIFDPYAQSAPAYLKTHGQVQFHIFRRVLFSLSKPFYFLAKTFFYSAKLFLKFCIFDHNLFTKVYFFLFLLLRDVIMANLMLCHYIIWQLRS